MLLITAIFLLFNIPRIFAGTQAIQQANYDILTRSVEWAKSNKDSVAWEPCSRNFPTVEALCIVQGCGLCEKYRHKGDAIERFECPQPLGFRGDIHTPLTLIFGYFSDRRVPTCRMDFSDSVDFFGKCQRILKNTRIPRRPRQGFFSRKKIQCSFNSYQLIPMNEVDSRMGEFMAASQNAMIYYGMESSAMASSSISAGHQSASAHAASHVVIQTGSVPRPVLPSAPLTSMTSTSTSVRHTVVATPPPVAPTTTVVQRDTKLITETSQASAEAAALAPHQPQGGELQPPYQP